MRKTIRIGILLFPDVLQMDLTGPYGVFAMMSGAQVDLIWKNKNPVKSCDGLILTPNLSFDQCPDLDVLCIPGGNGILELMEDEEVISFIQAKSKNTQYIASVCTGALVLGAAGLLTGHKATTHWLSITMLADFDALPVKERVVVDKNIITAAGVSAGIDMALVLAGKICGEKCAREMELNMEYDPLPPYGSGSPQSAPQEIIQQVIEKSVVRQKAREEVVKRVTKKIMTIKN